MRRGLVEALRLTVIQRGSRSAAPRLNIMMSKTSASLNPNYDLLTKLREAKRKNIEQQTSTELQVSQLKEARRPAVLLYERRRDTDSAELCS
jgi:hypothetical protein